MDSSARKYRTTTVALGLLVVFAVACARIPAGVRPSEPSPPARGALPHAPPTKSGHELENRIFAGINVHRASIGLQPFAHDARLSEIARTHSRDMADGTTAFGHDGFRRRAAQVHRVNPRASFAENVMRSTRPTEQVSEAAIRGWLDSATHRRNIEGAYTAAGIGTARDSRGMTYVTQVFVGN